MVTEVFNVRVSRIQSHRTIDNVSMYRVIFQIKFARILYLILDIHDYKRIFTVQQKSNFYIKCINVYFDFFLAFFCVIKFYILDFDYIL